MDLLYRVKLYEQGNDTIMSYFEQKMIFEDSLHWNRQQVSQFEPTFVCLHLTLLTDNHTHSSQYLI